jgi:hypothetical protein
MPHPTAMKPAGVLKAFNKSRKPILPVAIGTKMAIEIMVTPQLMPWAESNV